MPPACKDICCPVVIANAGFRVDADGFFTYFAVLLMAAYQARALGIGKHAQ